MELYIYVIHDPAWKIKSLNDNVYFTLRDIYANVQNTDMCSEAIQFCQLLLPTSSEYTNVLYQPKFVQKLTVWLRHLDKSDFHLVKRSELLECEYSVYMKVDDWWTQFEVLKRQLSEHSCAINTIESELELGF
jgi:hypothetical protein